MLKAVSAKKLQEFFDRTDIPAVKKTKRGEKEINLHEYIKSYDLKNLSEKSAEFEVILSAGGESNIKPDILVAKLCEFIGDSADESVEIHRTEIFYAKGEKMITFC